MKVKTKTDALLHCFDLWLWLAVTGADHKSFWPGWEFNGGYLEECCHDCPVCDYGLVVSINDLCNEKCIIKWKNNHCNEKRGAQFYNWDNAKTERARKKWALEIAILALEAL